MEILTSRLILQQTEVETSGGLVTANHLLAARAGAQILARSGNAVDATVATACAAGVVEPAMSGIGGRGYLLIHFPDSGETVAIDGHERAPAAAREDMFAVREGRQIPTQGWGPQVPVVDDANVIGPLAVAIPGVLGALAVAHGRYGRLPLASVLEPAIELADEGFEVSPALTATIAANVTKLARFPATAAIFLPDGRIPAPGVRLRQLDLARSYRLIAEHGADEFYRGSIARAIGTEMRRLGGILTEQDLAAFEPRVWEQPLVGTYRGFQLLGMPDATGGITLLQIMNLLERDDLAALDAFDPRYLHLLLEAMRVAFLDRLAVIEDGDAAPVPYAGLASKEFASRRRDAISGDRALEAIEPADPWPFNGTGQTRPYATQVGWRASDSDTTHFCVVDRDGVTVSMTQSIIDAFGSGVVVPGTGILLNSAMHNFNPIPGQLGSVAPGKRSVHNGTPTIVLDPDGRLRLAIGGAGGTKIITGVAPILVNVLDRDWSLQEAVAAPRVHNEGWESEVDDRIPTPVREELRRLGHRFSVVSPRFAAPAFSRINGISMEPSDRCTSGVDVFVDAGATGLA